MTTAAMTSAQPISVVSGYADRPRTMLRSCSPISTNAAPLNVKNSRFHTEAAAIRESASKICADLRLR